MQRRRLRRGRERSEDFPTAAPSGRLALRSQRERARPSRRPPRCADSHRGRSFG